jgi:hypothetical protein
MSCSMQVDESLSRPGVSPIMPRSGPDANLREWVSPQNIVLPSINGYFLLSKSLRQIFALYVSKVILPALEKSPSFLCTQL